MQVALPPAAARVFYGVRNLLIDLRFGAPLLGVKRSGVPGQAGVVNSDYSLYPHVFPRSLVRPGDVIVDVGAGKGRFVNWLLMLRLDNRIIGIEYDGKTAAATAHRLRRRANVAIVHADATQFLPPDGTLFFLFNPFEGEVMARFKQRAMMQFAGRSDVRFVYLRPLELAMFKNDGHWWVEEHEIPREALDARYRDTPSHRRYAILVPRGAAGGSATVRA
jgi:hypothetical protein